MVLDKVMVKLGCSICGCTELYKHDENIDIGLTYTTYYCTDCGEPNDYAELEPTTEILEIDVAIDLEES